MPHNNTDPGSPHQWLQYAISDLAIAKSELSDEIMIVSLCFHAHQTAEKSIKAVLVR